MSVLSHVDVRRQSRQVFGQFGEKWKANARANSALPRRDSEELRDSGLGRFAVFVAMGASLEGHIEVLKKYRDRFDIFACDKSFGVLLDHGIIPDAVHIADANIPFKWLEPYVDRTAGIKLISTAYANPEWTQAWKGDRYFYLNVDAIDSQHEFTPYFRGGLRYIPASSNISNAMVVFWTGCIDKQIENFGNYERYYLTGYDYSWRPDGNYYAFNNPTPKRHYMAHMALNDINGDVVRSSENLMFSARWLYMYLSTYSVLPVVNCSGRGMLDIAAKGDLEKEVSRIKNDPSARQRVIDSHKTAKSAWQTFKCAETSFANAKEALLWQ